MPLVELFCIFLTLCASATHTDSSLHTTTIKSSETDSSLPTNDLNFFNQIIQGDFDFQDSSSEMPPKIQEKRNLEVTCQNGVNGCTTCSTTDTSRCETCVNPATTLPDMNGGCTNNKFNNCALLETEGKCSQCKDNYYLDCTATCSDLIPSCHDCSDAKTCTECNGQPSTYVNNSGGCSSCTTIFAGCKSCSNASVCTGCGDATYVDGNQCKTCPEGCQSCTGPSRCTQCNTGYLFNELGTCSEYGYSGCDMVSSETLQCIKCSPSTYWFLELSACYYCYATLENCLYCTNDGRSCTQCIPKFYLNGASCVACSTIAEKCSDCSMDGICTKCSDGAIIDSSKQCTTSALNNCDVVAHGDGSTCITCSSGYGLSTDGKTCTPCSNLIDNCETCLNDGSSCIDCSYHYILTTSGKCLRSPFRNCKLVSDAGICQSCIAGYVNVCNTSTKSARNCKITYSNGSFCLECKKGYTWVDDGLCNCSVKHCLSCNSSDGSICDNCQVGHLKSASGDCNTCDVGYLQTVSGGCALSNLQNCVTTNDDGSQCSICLSTFLPDTTGTCVSANVLNCAIVEKDHNDVCNTCKPNCLFDTANKCVASVLQNCVKVEVGGTRCNTCKINYLQDTNSLCVLSSLENCLKVESNDGTKCNTCLPTYERGENGICFSCSSNCVHCTSPSVCIQCNKDYFLYDSDEGTICICNFYLACADSCSSCIPTPNCYECAELIVKDGNSCRIDSVGFEVGFEYPYIIFDFAHSSSKVYSIEEITAQFKNGATKATNNWSISSRNNTQLKIHTDNLHESELPLGISFTLI